MLSNLSEVLFSRFLQFKGNFVDGQSNWKYRDVAPLNNSQEKNWAFLQYNFNFKIIWHLSRLLHLDGMVCVRYASDCFGKLFLHHIKGQRHTKWKCSSAS